PETFIAGLITAVGAIDVIIPPSIPMIVYGAAAEESVARLYAAGVLPGLVIAAMLALYVMFRARRENFGAGEPFRLKVFLNAVGCFLDPLSAILLLSPLLVPLVKAAGIDTVHFGIVVTVNLAIGLFHPPFGINIFVAQSVLGLKLETIYRGIISFVIIYLVAL